MSGHNSETPFERLNTEVNIAVAVLTYRREDLLSYFLNSFEDLIIPENTKVTLLVIDNCQDGSGKAVFDAHLSQKFDFTYFHEPRRGIPVARNRAIDEACKIETNVLCFIDDDEVPKNDWLVELVDHWRTGELDLIGGPVEVAQAPKNANLWQKFVNASLAARMLLKNRKTARRANHPSQRYAVVTNNWLCDVKWLCETGLRFDERLLITGGSDTAFYRAARALGVRSGWCPNALVYETISTDRLSLSYQAFRGASQSTQNFFNKQKTITPSLIVYTLITACMRFVLGVGLLLVPVMGLASPVVAMRSIGWSYGRIKALRGGQSELYR